MWTHRSQQERPWGGNSQVRQPSMHPIPGHSPPHLPHSQVSEKSGILHFIRDVTGKETASAPFLMETTPHVHRKKPVNMMNKRRYLLKKRLSVQLQQETHRTSPSPPVSFSGEKTSSKSSFSSAFNNASKSRACPQQVKTVEKAS